MHPGVPGLGNCDVITLATSSAIPHLDTLYNYSRVPHRLGFTCALGHTGHQHHSVTASLTLCLVLFCLEWGLLTPQRLPIPTANAGWEEPIMVGVVTGHTPSFSARALSNVVKRLQGFSSSMWDAVQPLQYSVAQAPLFIQS